MLIDRSIVIKTRSTNALRVRLLTELADLVVDHNREFAAAVE